MEGSEVKPARAVPPKPAPFLPKGPPPSTTPPVVPSAHVVPPDGAPPSRPGRKPPPSFPPPPPPRVDLGEALAEVVGSIKQESNHDLARKGSPKLMPKGRPEITLVSAKPMDSSAVIPPPSAQSQPAPVREEPKLPQKPVRKSKGREPPPRPKTRPVSELTLETDEHDMGSVIGDVKVSRDIEGEEKTVGSTLLNESSGLKTAPVVPEQKVKNHKTEYHDVCREKDNTNDNISLEEKLEFNQKAKIAVVKEDRPVKEVAAKPAAIKAKPTENESKSPIELDGVKEFSLDNPGVPVRGTVSAGKKSKPTVIIAKPAKKTATLEPEERNRSEEQPEASKEEINLKQLPVTIQEKKPPPPAKKPKPAVKPKPSSIVEAPVKEPTEEKKLDSAVAPKPKVNPTVMLPVKPVKITEAPKPASESNKEKGENNVQEKASRPTVILPAKPSKMSEASKASDSEISNCKDDGQTCLKPVSAEPVELQKEGKGQQSAASQAVKPRRVPTVIRASRPEGQDISEVRKPPKRPQRGPSVRKAAPPRPDGASVKEDKEQGELIASTHEESNTVVSAQVTDKVQQKKPTPPRPVSMPGVKENETLIDSKKWHELESPLDTTLSRKGSRKRPPPPRPSAAEHGRREVMATPGTCDNTDAPDEKSKEKHRPPPPRPPAAEPDRGQKEPSSDICDEIHALNEKSKNKPRPAPRRPPMVEHSNAKADLSREALKTHDIIDKPKEKNKPPRPSSKALDSTPQKQLDEETGESHNDNKSKPVRPAPVVPKADDASRKLAETRTVVESSADEHAKDTSITTHDSAQEVGHSAAKGHEKAASKSKPKPPRPASSSSSSKNKPHRPSGPATKSIKKTKEEAAPTQVSSVRETYIEPSAIALYDYEPSAMDDLSFNAGDEIVLVKKIDDEWYVGRLGDQEGMFPVKFVEIIEDLPQTTTQESKPVAAASSSLFDVMALYDFHGNEHDGELVFNAGEMIHVSEKINDDWLKGEYRGQTGAFPCNFVDITTDVINKLPLSERNTESHKSDEGAATESRLVVQCKALFNYDSDVPDDLSFSAGDVIKVHKKIGDEWIEGELHGRVGMFPSTYVEILEHTQEENRSKTEDTKKCIVEYGKALYDFTASASDELSFKKGDKVEITEVVSDDWLRGKLGGHEGMFPRTFVQPDHEPLCVPKKATKVTPKAKALFDFDGEFEDELSFKVDDVIVLLERVNEEWFKGEAKSRVGRFPAAFVEVMTPLP